MMIAESTNQSGTARGTVTKIGAHRPAAICNKYMVILRGYTQGVTDGCQSILLPSPPPHTPYATPPSPTLTSIPARNAESKLLCEPAPRCAPTTCMLMHCHLNLEHSLHSDTRRVRGRDCEVILVIVHTPPCRHMAHN